MVKTKTKNKTNVKVVKPVDEFSNIITPPDFVRSRAHTVVIIDPEWTEIEDLAFYLKTAKAAYNVYVYRTEMNDDEWLKKAMAKSTHIIVNTINNNNSYLKDKLAVHHDTWYYGNKRFLMNSNRIERPIDYFIKIDGGSMDHV